MIRSRFRKPRFARTESRAGRPGLSRCSLLLVAFVLVIATLQFESLAGQSPAKKSDSPVTVRFTDIRKQAGISFLQDSTQTEEKL